MSFPSAVAPLWGHQLDQAVASQTTWLWRGYLAAGNITLLTSPPKCGKTTLLSVLLHHLKAGGTLAGQPVRPGRAAVVTEESTAHWQARRQHLVLAEQVCFLCRPFRTKPSPEQWHQLLGHLLALDHAHDLDLIVLDPLSAFLPGRGENHAGTMLETLLPLQRLTERGLCVLLLHHPSKDEAALGLSARGSGALAGFADILLELRRRRGAPAGDRRRQLVGLSRHPETPPVQVLELNADGTDYACVAEEEPDDDFSAGWWPIRLVLEDASGKLTRAQLLEQWPPDFPRPSAVTLWRWLTRASAEGRVRTSGTGRSSDPFRYWLAEKEESFRADPIQQLLEEQEELVKRLQTGMGARPSSKEK
jgi:hypothetical protein